jgi:hypothetical protein
MHAGSEPGRYLAMGTNPDTFFDGFQKTRRAAQRTSQDAQCLKLLLRHFREVLDVDMKSIWEDDGIHNKMAEVRFRTSNPVLKSLHYLPESLPLEKIYRNFPGTSPWKELISVYDSGKGEDVAVLFTVRGLGLHVLHTFSPSSRVIPRAPRLVWSGNAGLDLTLEHSHVFLEKYK